MTAPTSPREELARAKLEKLVEPDVFDPAKEYGTAYDARQRRRLADFIALVPILLSEPVKAASPEVFRDALERISDAAQDEASTFDDLIEIADEALSTGAVSEAASPEREACERVSDVAKQIEGFVTTIQADKRRVDAGHDPHNPGIITDAINAMPGWVTELREAEFEIDADFEALEDKLQALSTPPTSERAEVVADDEWPRALARLRNTEPHPDQGIACVGTADLAMALDRLEQFADVALGNAMEISRLLAPAPAQQVEPVAWRWRKIGAPLWQFDGNREWPPLTPPPGYEVEPLYAAPPKPSEADQFAQNAKCSEAVAEEPDLLEIRERHMDGIDAARRVHDWIDTVAKADEGQVVSREKRVLSFTEDDGGAVLYMRDNRVAAAGMIVRDLHNFSIAMRMFEPTAALTTSTKGEE